MKITLTPKFYMHLSLVLAVLLWMIDTLIDILQILAVKSEVDLGISPPVHKLIEAVFLIFVIIFYRYQIRSVEGSNFVDLLWRVFATGLVTTIISLVIQTILQYY